MSLDQLNHALVTATEGAEPQKWMLFLHGILGSGANWRTVAKRFIASKPEWGAVLVDLRKHGASQDFAGPHTVVAAAKDLERLSYNVQGVVGHSFGGKVALEYARTRRLEELFLIDSNPGPRPDARGSEGTVRVLEMLEALPPTFGSRPAFIAHIQSQGHDAAVAQWLAMNLERDGDVLRFGLDMKAIRALLEDYFARDLWSVLEAESDTRFTVILGGKSNVFDASDKERLAAIAANHANVKMHVIARAGHWVHADAPDELHQVLVNPTA
jgi:esterase